MGVLSKCSQHQTLQYGYLLCESVRKNNTPETPSDVSEVFVWSASEMCLAP